MITTIIGIILILYVHNNSCLEKRRSFEKNLPAPFGPWESHSGPLLPCPPPSVTPPPQLLENKEFDFHEHWLKMHTKMVTQADGKVEYIIEKEKPFAMRPDHEYCTLHEAVIANDIIALKRMLKSQSHREHLDSYNIEGQTPLQAAVEFGSDQAIAYLVQEGAHANFQNRDGEYTAWILAKEYARSVAHMNVVPLMVLSQALAQKGELEEYARDKKKKRFKKDDFKKSTKPKKIIRLRRRVPVREATPELPPENEYDSYLLNV
ncbi:MAG: hypothetical protein AMXMBFR12_08070 [Candidatus Babeliales bacterium]